jgi:uncharacterized protein YecE (DUF72 family)
MKKAAVHIGCSGWNYRHWRGPFYKEESSPADWFREYSSVFSTVEINNTFYNLPAGSVFRSWKDQAPERFIYAVKANRFITHMKKLKDAGAAAGNFLDRAELLGKHLGPVLFQLPPNWKRDAGRLEDFTRSLPAGHEYVFEFRNATWYDDEIFRMLSDRKMSMCLHDMEGSSSPLERVGNICYIRFHGSGAKYGGGYKKPMLLKWLRVAREALESGRHVYAYFNNDAEAHAPHDALTFRKMFEKV